MKRLLILLTFLLNALFVYPQITFEQTYGGAYNEQGSVVLQTNDGGYLIAGSTHSWAYACVSIYLIRTNKYGDTLWTKSIRRPMSWATSITKTHDDNYVIAAYTGDSVSYNGNISYFKIDDGGNMLWSKIIACDSVKYYGDVVSCITLTKDKGFAMTGHTRNHSTGNLNAFLLKTDKNGDTLWMKTYDAGYKCDYIGTAVRQTTDKGYVITGVQRDGAPDIILIRTNKDGVMLWKKVYPGPGYDQANSVLEINGIGFLIAGFADTLGNYGRRILLISTNHFGDTVWTRSFAYEYGGSGGCLIKIKNKKYALVGTANFDVFLTQFDENGTVEWTKTFGEPGPENIEWGLTGALTSDDGFIISGMKTVSGAMNQVYLIKTGKNGKSSGVTDMTSENEVLEISPNPASDFVKVKFPGNFGKIRSLELFNNAGQLVLRKTDHFTEIDISSLITGLYVLVVTNSENKTLTGKIIKE